MTTRQQQRARRSAENRYAHWSAKFLAATGDERLAHAFDYLRARVNDLPKPLRAGAAEAIADTIIGMADQVTDGELEQPRTAANFARHRPLPGGLRTDARARARA